MSIIKPKRGTGSPAGSIATNEIAMDTTAKKLYVSTNGTDAISLADDSRNYLENVSYFLGSFNGDFPQKATLGNNDIATYGAQNASIEIRTGQYAAGANKGPVKINALSLDMDSNPITNIKSLAISDTVGGNADMILTQDQYTPNSIEILADKSQNGGRSSLWYNFDNAGSKEYIGTQLWQADSGGTAGDHYFKIASYKGSGANNDVIIDSWKDHYTRLGNGFHDSGNNQPLGSLKLQQDSAEISGLALNVSNGREASTGALGPNSLRVTTDMSQDTTVGIMNSATFALNYGSSAIPTSYTQNTMTFTVQNDAGETAGDDPVVGRITAAQNADPLQNQIILRASNHGNTGGNADNGATQGGAATLNAYSLNINVPVALPVYTLSEANALSSTPEGSMIYVTNGNAGAKTLAVWDGSNWKVVALGATIS